jgi:hypothetical protein
MGVVFEVTKVMDVAEVSATSRAFASAFSMRMLSVSRASSRNADRVVCQWLLATLTRMFDTRCRENGIEHRLTKTKHPWPTVRSNA